MSLPLIDVLDETGQPTGQVLDMEDAHMQSVWHAASHVWLLNNNDEVLLQYRAEDKMLWPGFWDISAAGHIDSGETALQAAVRETKEEPGLELKPEDLHVGHVLKGELWVEAYGSYHKEFWHMFFGKIEDQELTLQAEEVSDVKWVSLSDLALYMTTPEKYKFLSHGEEYDQYVLEQLRRLA